MSFPPLPVAVPGDAAERLLGTRVDVADAVIERLRSVCATVDTDAESCAEGARDWWPLGLLWARGGEVPRRPSVVARPDSVVEVAAILEVCFRERVPVTPFAGRSGVCGGSVPKLGGVSLDLAGLSGIVEVCDHDLTARVAAGMNGLRFETALRDEHYLSAGHWPQSIALASVGGWVACRGAGQYSTRYGKVEDMVVGLEVVRADGTVLRTGGRAPREAAGPDLSQLFVGSEGTLGVITEVQLRVHELPRAAGKLAYAFPTFLEGLEACRRILRRGATPAVLRLYDTHESQRYDGDGRSVLLVLDEAEPGLLDATLKIVGEECRVAEALDPVLVDAWLSHRNDVSQLGTALEHGYVVDTYEIAGRWSALPTIYEQVCSAARKVSGLQLISAHQSHAYPDGACLYFTFAGVPDGDPDSFYLAASDAITKTTLAAGGALSHHHGIGLNRARHLEQSLGAPAFASLTAIKQALDPAGILNPGGLGLPSALGVVSWP